MTTRSKVLLALSAGIALLTVSAAGVGFVFDRLEHFSAHYRTYAEAKLGGAVDRGWVPRFVPGSATDIDEAHDIDTNYQALSFKAPLNDLRASVSALEIMSLSEARALGYQDSWFAPRSPPELDKNLLASPRGSLKVYRFRSSPWNLCVIVNWTTGEIFAWSCEMSHDSAAAADESHITVPMGLESCA